MKGGVMPSGGELWTTNCRVRDDMAAQWEQILSAAYVPWTVAIAEHSHWDAYRAWLRRWRIDDLALVTHDSTRNPRRRLPNSSAGPLTGCLRPREVSSIHAFGTGARQRRGTPVCQGSAQGS